MRHLRAGVATLALLMTVGGGVGAQVVRGRFYDVESGLAVDAGVVTLLDSAGVVHGQTLTSPTGTYLLRAPGPGVYRLRGERIGLEEVFSGYFSLGATSGVERDLATRTRALSLEGLTVSTGQRCRLASESGLPTYLLWSAIRAALEATSLTARERRLRYEIVEYSLLLDPQAGSLIGPPQAQSRSGLADHPFHSAPVDELVHSGFVRRGTEETSYFAPDAQVLLADEFLQSHCFQVGMLRAARAGGEDVIGLEFRPLREESVGDVHGTLWVALPSYQLRRLDFTYTNLSVPDGEQLGGEVEFTKLPTGRWVVSRWYVRVPIAEAELPPRRLVDVPPGQTRRHLETIREQGGYLVSARDTAGHVLYARSRTAIAMTVGPPGTPNVDSIAWSASPREEVGRVRVPTLRPTGATISGLVRDAESGQPIVNAHVTLEAAADPMHRKATLSDDRGRYSFTAAEAGAYHLKVESIGYQATEGAVRVGASELQIYNVEMVAEPVPLEGVVVEARFSEEMKGFRARRARNIGAFVDRPAIERANAARASDLVRGVPGLRIVCTGVANRCVLRTSAAPAAAGPDKGDCPVQYFLDGVLTPGLELDDLRPAEIEAIEVYTHAASVPARFNVSRASRCGVVVVWTGGQGG